MSEKIMPAFVTDNETGEKFELDFCRETIVWAEGRGFKLESVADFPVTGISDLFYYSFRMHHRNVARDKTDKLMKKWKGLPEKLLDRLIQLYQQAQTATTIQTDEDAEKNALVTLEL